MSFTRDRLNTLRQGTSALTATEAAGVNIALVPPGLYTYDIMVPIAPTGTSPTCVATWQEAADGSTWAAINAQVAHTVDGTATAAKHYTGTIRVTKQPNAGIAGNLTVILTVGGTTPSFGKVVVALTKVGGTSGFSGAP